MKINQLINEAQLYVKGIPNHLLSSIEPDTVPEFESKIQEFAHNSNMISFADLSSTEIECLELMLRYFKMTVDWDNVGVLHDRIKLIIDSDVWSFLDLQWVTYDSQMATIMLLIGSTNAVGNYPHNTSRTTAVFIKFKQPDLRELAYNIKRKMNDYEDFWDYIKELLHDH